ncbi:MAG: hypothetical protein QXN55_01190 [Candidatus Nitrosotenuis sp.]
MAEPTPYVPKQLCIGQWRLQDSDGCTNDSSTLEQYVAESIEIAGAPINVFKLLGVHEQGRLMDLTGAGTPLSSGSASGSDVNNAFDISADSWKSSQVGPAVVSTPAWIGYYFGSKKTSFGTEKYRPPSPILQHITTLKIQQGPNVQNRALQVRIDRADGTLDARLVSQLITSTAILSNIRAAQTAKWGTVYVTATSSSQFSVSGPSGIETGTIGSFKGTDVLFDLQGPLNVGDIFRIELDVRWKRADIVNLPNTSNLEQIAIRQTAPASYWRLVPLIFNGGPTDSWEIVKLELIDFQSTSIDNIEDTFFLENRDRDYSSTSIEIKAQYQPVDSLGDLGKFGFNLLDQYAFSVSFSRMVELLGRPIVIGDVIEVTPELAYDQKLKPVKKFLEVSDASWAAEGFTPGWKPTVYRFTAVQLLPSQEHRDIFGTSNDQLYKVDDGTFFNKIGQHQDAQLLVAEDAATTALDQVPETGADPQEIASGAPLLNNVNKPGDRTDQQDLYVEDAIPPDGLPYREGFTLPDANTAVDGEYFRQIFPPDTRIPARLYKFNIIKHRWIYQETDMRDTYSSHKPSIRSALVSLGSKSLKSDL